MRRKYNEEKEGALEAVLGRSNGTDYKIKYKEEKLSRLHTCEKTHYMLLLGDFVSIHRRNPSNCRKITGHFSDACTPRKTERQKRGGEGNEESGGELRRNSEEYYEDLRAVGVEIMMSQFTV